MVLFPFGRRVFEHRIYTQKQVSRSEKTAANGIQTQNHLVREQTLNQLAKLAIWLSVRLRIKWLWVRILLLSLKLKILHMF